jgi:hypothetical protein
MRPKLALSIRQPFAEQIMGGKKKFEYRSIPNDADVLKYAGFPWGSVVEITGDGERLCFISGPAIYKKGQWVLPVVFCHDWFEDPGKARQFALKEYRSRGYAPRPGRGL